MPVLPPQPSATAPDDALAAALPPPPPFRADRRDAAIEAAMRRFDGVEDPARRGGRGSRSPRLNRPLVGTLVAAGLVLSIGLPVWMVSDHGPPPAAEERPADPRPPAPGAPPAAPPMEIADAMAPPPVATQAPRTAGPPRTAEPSRPAPPASGPSIAASIPPTPSARQESERAFALAPPPPPPPAPHPPPAPPPAVAAAAPAAAESEDANIVVTGSRINRARSDAAEGRARASRAAAPRRDWNSCTVADPSRDLAACGAMIDEAVPGRGAAAVRDGVSLAWQGNLDAALAAFDRAIERSPRSAFAYYNRSLLLRQRGDTRGAAADKERAIALDNRYRSAFEQQ